MFILITHFNTKSDSAEVRRKINIEIEKLYL